MTTATIDVHPAVAEAQKRLDPLVAEQTRLETERREAWATARLRDEFSHEAMPAPPIEETLSARIRLREIDDDLRRLQLRVIPAQRTLDEARTLARREALAAIDEQRRGLVGKLDGALLKAAKISADIAELDDAALHVSGGSAVRAGWHELAADTPSYDSRLAAWRRSMRDHGLLD